MGVLSTHSQSLAVALGISVGVAGAVFVYKKLKQDDAIPTEWIPLGEVTDLYCFPIKSCAPIHVQEIACEAIGVQNGLMRDRVFVVVNSDTGKFVTGRRYPELVLVQSKIDDHSMTLSVPGTMPDITIDINEVLAKQWKRKVKVWEATMNVVDCGDEAAKWFSRYLLKTDDGMRLVYYPLSKPTRPIDPVDKKRWPKTTSEKHTGSLHDATSYMIMNSTSVDELNKRLEEPVSTLQFRPNIVFKGAVPFEEDAVRWVKIGEKTIFKYVQPCLRCTFTTVNPDNGVKNAKNEPLKTLKSFRCVPEFESPVFGVHLGLAVPDSIKVGDMVYAGKTV